MPQRRDGSVIFYSEHPATSIRLLSPHSANIDRAKFEQQCGGNLARAQPDFARGMTIFERTERVPKKVESVFARDQREAFARRSCSENKAWSFGARLKPSSCTAP
jgi:hypothetical protein